MKLYFYSRLQNTENFALSASSTYYRHLTELKAVYLAYYLDTALFSSFLWFPNLWSNIEN